MLYIYTDSIPTFYAQAMITKETILTKAASMRELLQQYDAADAAHQAEYAAFAAMWRSGIQSAEEFMQLSEQEQSDKLAALNRMTDKMQSGV